MNKSTINNLAHSRKVFKKTLLVSTIISALSVTTSLQAQESEAAQADDSGVEVIMVTDSKCLTGLQKTPIAVSVVGAETIEQTKVLDIGDLQRLS